MSTRAETETVDTVPVRKNRVPSDTRRSALRGNRRNLDLMNDPPGSTLRRLAIPLAFGFIINAVYSWTDMYFVSRLGDAATAALGFSDQLNFVLFTLGNGFCLGTGVVVARRIGEGKANEASTVATQSFSFMAVYATTAAVLLSFILPSVLPLFGLSGEVLSLTRIYMLTLLFGFPGNLLTFQANASVRSTGNTVFPMAVLVISALCNALVDPVLIFGLFGFPKLGIRGAAISTSLAQWVGAGICAYALYSGKLNIRLHRPTLKFDRELIWRIFRIGIPASLQTLAVSTSRLVVISIINVFGTTAVAAYTIGLKVDILVFMPIFAAGIAIETLVSQSIGAERFERVKEFRATAIRQLSGVTIGMGALIYLFAGEIARIFTTTPEVIDLTVRYLHIAVFGYFFFVIGQTGTRMLSGAGHSLRSMLIVAGMLFLVQVPLAYALSHWTGLAETGVFLAIALGYLAFAVISSLTVRGEKWMMKKV